MQITENGDTTQNDKASPPPAKEIANGKPRFFKNSKKSKKPSKYGIVGVFGGGMVNKRGIVDEGGGILNGGLKEKTEKPPKPVRSYSKIAQIFDEYSVSKIKVSEGLGLTLFSMPCMLTVLFICNVTIRAISLIYTLTRNEKNRIP